MESKEVLCEIKKEEFYNAYGELEKEWLVLMAIPCATRKEAREVRDYCKILSLDMGVDGFDTISNPNDIAATTKIRVVKVDEGWAVVINVVTATRREAREIRDYYR